MKDALGELGWLQSVLVNRHTGVVVDGHMRVAVALKQGQPTVPVSYVELDDAEEARVLATLNPLGALAYEDAEARDALRGAAAPQSDALRALIGLDPADISPSDPEPPPSDREGMERDHTKAIAEGDDDDGEAWADEWGDDAYTGEAIRLISFVMTVPEYEAALDALERIGEREGLETNADTVLWLIERYAPETAGSEPREAVTA